MTGTPDAEIVSREEVMEILEKIDPGVTHRMTRSERVGYILARKKCPRRVAEAVASALP